MERHKLNRMFDVLTPNPERERALLEELLRNDTKRKTSAKSMKNWKRVVASVAATALLMTCTVAAAAASALFRVRISEPDEEGTIWLSEGIAYYPLDSLSEEIKALEGQSEELLSFDSWESAEKFVGLDLMNNPVLDASPAEYYSYSIDTGNKRVHGRFAVMTHNNLQHIRIHGCYEIGEVDIDVESELFTDSMAAQNDNWDEKFLGYHFPEETDVERETYVASSGLEAQIMQIDRGKDHKYTCLATFSLNGVPTVVSTHSHDSPEDARRVLIQILDGFTL